VGWGEAESTRFGTSANNWPIVPAPDDRWWVWSIWWNKKLQRKAKYSEEICLSATLFTTNPTWLDPGSNRGRRSRKPLTNRLSYGTTYARNIQWVCVNADLCSRLCLNLLKTLKLQLVSWKIVGLTAAKFMPLMLLAVNCLSRLVIASA
jgi:hypothetical protein